MAQAESPTPFYHWFTTDFIVDETLTLLRVRKEASRALALGQQFFQGMFFLHVFDQPLVQIRMQPRFHKARRCGIGTDVKIKQKHLCYIK